jgi:hypothetical protein
MSTPESAIALQLLGSVQQTAGSYYAAKGQSSAYGAEAAIADVNSRLSETSAQGALIRGRRQYQAKRLESAALKGAQRVALANNNVALDSDTAVNLQTSADVLGEIDANTIQANALAEAWGYRTQGVNFRSQAAMARANKSATSPFGSAMSTALTGAGDVGFSYWKMKQAGALGNTNSSGWKSTPYSGTNIRWNTP